MNFTFREYSLLALAILAAVWFFSGYPSQDPRSAIRLSADKQKIEERAVQFLDQLGYIPDHFKSEITFKNNRVLLDSLQHKMGRQQLTKSLKQKEHNNLLAFYWENSFYLKSSYRKARDIEVQISNSDNNIEENNTSVRLRLDSMGRVMELSNPLPLLPSKEVNRKALAAAFADSGARSQAVEWMQSVPDSALASRIQLNLQSQKSPDQLTDSSRLNPDDPNSTLELTKRNVLQMAAFYLEKSGWDAASLQVDTVRVEGLNETKTVNVRYRSAEPVMGIPLELELELLPAGALLEMESSYKLREGSNGGLQSLWPVFRNGLIFLFVLAGIIVFFFRIRARAVDTKPALLIGILGGVAVSASMLLATIPEINFFTNPNYWTVTILVLVGVGLAGATASLAFFVFAAIGDSITRQHWIEKLSINDYLRQGMIYNQPIGFMLIRSVLCAFILAGIWTLSFWIMPHLFIDIRRVFLHGDVIWPPLYLLLNNSWIALSIVLGIFLALGSQTYAQTGSRVASFALITFAFATVAPLTGSYGPVLAEIVLAGIIGVALALIYLQWDAVTLFLSFFLFTGLISTVSGWIIVDSQDSYIFISYMIFMALILFTGIWAVSRGRDEQMLSPFVPDYVEELAQEERIKQELQIARDVQQSFLPMQTPRFEHVELAAVCEPAHETGGDYYDIIPLDEHRIAVTIGDVSGKGIQAAFYMTFIKGILHSLCREVESPAELLKKANRLFCENAPRGVFISLVYGIIDLQKREFRFARAGHNPILHLNDAAEQITELKPKGIGVGLDAGEAFDCNIEELTLSLEKHDQLILYTDGIVEAMNANQVFYGTHRLQNLLAKNRSQSAADMLDALTSDIHSFVGEAKQHDDMTMMVIKFKV